MLHELGFYAMWFGKVEQAQQALALLNIVENRWKQMKIDENRWKQMKIVEKRCKQV